MKYPLCIAVICSVLSLGCQKNQESELFKNYTSVDVINSVKMLNDNGVSVQVIPTVKEEQKSLLLGYPLGLVGESSLFGAVITKVSEKNNENMGMLKMSGFSASIQTGLKQNNDQWSFEIIGCAEKCGETSEVKTLFSIPVTELKKDEGLVVLDLSKMGESLDIISLLDGKDIEVDHSAENWKLLSSIVSHIDFSLATLVFDIESKYQYTVKGVLAPHTMSSKEVTIVSRWYFRLGSALSPYFEPRSPIKEVGYFNTSYDSDRKYITRFSIYNLKNRPIKYYLKNIPGEYRSSFAGSFENWNSRLYPVLGHNIFTYEFVEKEDPRYEKIVTGDIRYNVLEWDIDNEAPYGGLGPAIAYPLTGETLAAQVLIQGPKVVELYKNWFKLSSKESQQKLMRAANKVVNKKYKLRVGQHIQMSIPAQEQNLKDPVANNPSDFLETPEGYSYETYMDGYFRDMVTHELGHNLGLRHNFRGSLGNDGSMKTGSVSRSVMEYLNRTYRHLDRIGDYDVMAIAYGYLGQKPAHEDWFCTDEGSFGLSPLASAECSSSDATDDPFSFFEAGLKKVVDKLLHRGSVESPQWTAEELEGAYPDYVVGMARYVISAPYTAYFWTNFFGKNDRPNNLLLVSNFVLDRMNKIICDETIAQEIDKKINDSGKNLARKNIKDFRAGVKNILSQFVLPVPLLNSKTMKCLN